MHAPIVVSTLLEADVGMCELLNVPQVLTLCPESEITLKVYFVKVDGSYGYNESMYFPWAKCYHGINSAMLSTLK